MNNAVRQAKVYVDVKVGFDKYGRMLPLMIIWEDGQIYRIDKVTDIRRAFAMRAGGQGDRYTVWINGFSSFLFFERNPDHNGKTVGRWFVERRTAS